MDLKHFQEIFNNEPSYRLKQAQKGLFQDLINSWKEATVFPLDLREKLDKECPIAISAKKFTAQDQKTVKALITLDDGLKIEAVLMKHADHRNTVCVSSQVGCALSCSFCATGKLGFKRNLQVWEIVEQVLFFARYLKKAGERVTNIVFMGMGEPFLNYDNVIGAIMILNAKDCYNLGARHFSISTVGVVEGIEKLSKEKLQINLAISLHAPDNQLRSKLMGINNKYPIEDVLKSVSSYVKKTKRRVMLEYIMIKGVNDSEKHAHALAKLARNPLYFVNLITYSETGMFKPSVPAQIKMFKKILEQERVAVTQRYRFGENIKGACGQLALDDEIDS
ncbi:MAG: 23S rRNA (adenine(2503)-C(2))-methyltransferase RlmN [Candidatus Staskawiczbacteria bacterium]|jgi:23S rRNA (adenine2503-C2)-methyltransferase